MVIFHSYVSHYQVGYVESIRCIISPSGFALAIDGLVSRKHKPLNLKNMVIKLIANRTKPRATINDHGK